MSTFKAHCARGHDRRDFTCPLSFEAHMIGEHHARKPQAGLYRDGGPPAPGWRDGKIQAPTPWGRPPKRNPHGGLDAVIDRVAAGEYVWPGWGPAAEIPEEQWVPLEDAV